MEKEYTGHYKDIYVRDPQGNVMAVYRIRKDSLYLYEIPMYGSNRLGVIKEKMYLTKKHTQNSTSITSLPVLSIPQLTAFTGKQTVYSFGKKHYESVDWLGNVRVTYTDKKSWNNGNFALNVSSTQDYYPFGAVMEGRRIGSVNYRYGFNSQEKVDEISCSGNHYTAEYWEIDTRISRRWNIDPVVKPWLSGYVTFRNNPIIFKDPYGDDDVFTNSKTGKTTIIKTKDDFDRHFVDGKQEGEKLEQGWGVNTYGENARIVDLSEEWNREYLYYDDRIIGLAAFKSGQDWMDDGEVDSETPAVSFHFGVIDLGGNLENSGFYQTFYSDFNPGEEPGYRLDGNSRGIYPDARVAGSLSFVSEEKNLFDLYMFDEPQRVHFPSENWKNMVWQGNTSFLYKPNSGQISNLITLKWGFTVKGFVVTPNKVEKTDSPSQFHLENMPTEGSLDPNEP